MVRGYCAEWLCAGIRKPQVINHYTTGIQKNLPMRKILLSGGAFAQHPKAFDAGIMAEIAYKNWELGAGLAWAKLNYSWATISKWLRFVFKMIDGSMNNAFKLPQTINVRKFRSMPKPQPLVAVGVLHIGEPDDGAVAAKAPLHKDARSRCSPIKRPASAITAPDS